MKNNKDKKRGFSLLELMLAVAVFALGATVMISLLIDSNLSTRLSTEKTNSLFFAKEGIDATRTIRDNGDWADLTAGNHGLDNSSGDWIFNGESDTIDSSLEVDDNKYTRVVNIENVSTSTKNISVIITWNLANRPATTTIRTILTNWKNQ
jgi:prepilin-type N-terminal cleavage/methylation domain-containing protein